jgi:hypothetical protein
MVRTGGNLMSDLVRQFKLYDEAKSKYNAALANATRADVDELRMILLDAGFRERQVQPKDNDPGSLLFYREIGELKIREQIRLPLPCSNNPEMIFMALIKMRDYNVL